MEKKDKIKELTEKVVQLGELEKAEDLIHRNVYEFDFEDKKYRVRKPSYSERALISKERNRKYVEMLQDDAYELEEKLIEMYNKKGISIKKMENQIKVLQKTEDDILEKLAQTKDPKDIDTFKTEVMKLRDEQSEIYAKQSDLLHYSLERQLNEYINSYTVYLLLEVQDEENWEKIADTYEDFLKIDNEQLFVQSAYLLTLMLWQNNV